MKVKLVMSQSAKTDLAMIRFLCLATRVLQTQPKKKDAVSHRGKALTELKAKLENYFKNN